MFGPAGLQQRTVGSARQYAQGDGLGSVRLITDGSGNAAGAATFEPWGAPKAGATSLGGFGFTGEQTDAETGFVYLRARHYDPATGRFLEQDSYAGPPGNPQGQHRFAYAEGNPVRYTDPSGHTVFDPGMAGDFGYGPPIAGAAGALAIGAWLQQNKQQVDQFWQTTTTSVGQWWQQLCSSSSNTSNSSPPPISKQKQAGHVFGTPQYKNRLANPGDSSTSYFPDEETAERLVQEAWEKGTPVPNRPGMREYDFGRPVGKDANGGEQWKVTVVQDGQGRIHGYPSGREHTPGQP